MKQVIRVPDVDHDGSQTGTAGNASELIDSRSVRPARESDKQHSTGFAHIAAVERSGRSDGLRLKAAESHSNGTDFASPGHRPGSRHNDGSPDDHRCIFDEG
jgi:hypothetical protein